VEELPERGELVLELGVPLAGETIDVNLSAVGFRPAKVSVPIVRDGTEVAANGESHARFDAHGACREAAQQGQSRRADPEVE
jgi:hypothetical protein